MKRRDKTTSEGAELHLHALARIDPRTAIRHARGHRHQERWSLSDVLMGPGEQRLLRDVDEGERESPRRRVRGRLLPGAWWYPLRMPPWATPDAVDSVRRALLRSASRAEPLGPDRGQHAALGTIRAVGQQARLAGHVMSPTGLPMSFPFLDDRVIEACLSVRAHERTTPAAYKPLLRAAFGDLVPARVLARSTKDHCATEWFRGLRRRRAEMAALCEDSLLPDEDSSTRMPFASPAARPRPHPCPCPQSNGRRRASAGSVSSRPSPARPAPEDETIDERAPA
ncbi:asparagine synthase-related protein [Streptomyces sp. NPDC092307]|uniref:asparagine synthase-related protein n=1 Tax=Streptomyces sp. NPDC092307 TaxID=3366013 RepID=UPI0038047347